MKEKLSRRQLLSGVAAGTTVTLAGCTGGDSGDDTTSTDGTSSDGETTTKTYDENQLEDQLTVALPTDPTAGVWSVYGGVMPYYTNTLEPLIWVTDDMELQPWLASNWESTGEKSWEFTIRDGVKFHNGETLTAEHVVWSFETVLNEWSYAPGWLHVKPENVTALDDRTVEFVTTDVFPTFPGTIAHNMVAIQHPDRSRENKDVIGTGPYQVTNRKKGQRVETEAFNDYWNGDVQMQNLDFRVITDPTTRSLALENNEVDVAYSPPSSKIDSLSENSNTQVTKQTSPGAMYVGLHNYKEPTNDVKLRKALNWATSQKTLVDTILNNVGLPARGPVAKSIYWSGHEKLPEYKRDVEKATSLVEESAYDGQTLQFLVGSQTPSGRTIASALQEWYSEIGVDVAIKQVEESAFEDAVRSGGGHLVLESSGSNSGAADYLIYETFHSEGDVNERLYQENGTGVYNPGEEVDTLIEEGFQTGDKELKEEKYEEALRIIMEDEASVVPLTYQQYVVGSYKDVENLDLRPINEMVRWPGTKHLK
ncbi:ABC transporter substrate-binding protein [Halobacterium sp. DL1]|jgi:peptide/nickel transport system substrate-binding protein|nr:ABC transporter substrate-binding protein [Halobacterium sp. DL1]